MKIENSDNITDFVKVNSDIDLHFGSYMKDGKKMVGFVDMKNNKCNNEKDIYSYKKMTKWDMLCMIIELKNKVDLIETQNKN